MGLDMYLKKSNWYSIYDFSAKPYSKPKKTNIVIEVEYEDGHKKTQNLEENFDENTYGGIEIEVPFMYWRKANQIHKWFVDLSGEEDKCQKISVTGRQILELVDICKQVLEDHSKAEELLPVQEGFFFGSYEYDDWYFQDLEYTVKKLENVNPDDEFIYQTSW